jgi:hypothetical protein
MLEMIFRLMRLGCLISRYRIVLIKMVILVDGENENGRK